MSAAQPHTNYKLPQVTALFWVLKIAATTLGETGGDLLAQTLNLGYAAASILFLGYLHREPGGPIAGRPLSSRPVLAGIAYSYNRIRTVTETAPESRQDRVDVAAVDAESSAGGRRRER